MNTATSSRDRNTPPAIALAIDDIRPLAETIWSSLVGLRAEDGKARILFTGTEESCGTTLVTASCGLGLARNTRSEVVLVESHLRRPAMASFFGIDPAPGLSDLLVGQASLEEVRRQVPGCAGLTVISAGTPRLAVVGEFAADGAREMLDAIAGSARYVLFDAPPIVDHSESRALLGHVDGAVLVLRARSSRRSDARRAIELVEAAGVEVLGSVLNRFKPELPFGVE